MDGEQGIYVDANASREMSVGENGRRRAKACTSPLILSRCGLPLGHPTMPSRLSSMHWVLLDRPWG